jgi:hypothetical protein
MPACVYFIMAESTDTGQHVATYLLLRILFFIIFILICCALPKNPKLLKIVVTAISEGAAGSSWGMLAIYLVNEARGIRNQ